MDDSISAVAGPGVSEPSMAMSELRQRLCDWYVGQGYAENTIKASQAVLDLLCDFVGMRSDYTPGTGQDYVRYASDVRGYSHSHMNEVRRAVYVFDCLAGGVPVLAQRQDSGPGCDASASIPMERLRELIVGWRDDPLREGPPSVTLYVLGHVAAHIGLTALYVPSTGAAFLEHMGNGGYCAEYMRSLSRKVYLLDCLVSGERIVVQRSSGASTVGDASFPGLLDGYAARCRQAGNKDSTVTHKRRYAGRLLGNIESCGCHDLSALTPDVVIRATLIDPVTGCNTYYRSFLRYLSDEGLAPADYSSLVPPDRRVDRLPDVYGRDEILSLEASYDRGTDRGKRDYAMVLLASRLKLRPSDIVALRIDQVDFDGGHISIVQQKTGVELVLPLVPELREALSEYLAVRPRSDSPCVFLRSHAPYLPMSPAAVHDVTTAGFDAAGIEAGGRSTGPRALRSSGASHMIEGGESYKFVQDSLGQRNRDVVRHYARLDVEHLRMSALEPPKVTEGSFFSRFLAGEATP